MSEYMVFDESGYEKDVGLIDLKFDHEDARIWDEEDEEVDVSLTIRWTRGITENISRDTAFRGFIEGIVSSFASTDAGVLSEEHQDGMVESMVDSLAECGMSLAGCSFQDGRLSIWIVQRDEELTEEMRNESN